MEMLRLLCLIAAVGVTSCGKQEAVDSLSTMAEITAPSGRHIKGALTPVNIGNLQYKTESYKGFTSPRGEYYYLPGETIEFSIGAIAIPAMPASASVSLVDAVAAMEGGGAKRVVDISRAQALNFFGLLLTLDQDGSPDNGITISPRAHQTAPYLPIQTPLASFYGSRLIRDWMALLSDIGEARAPAIISEYETLAFLTDLMESYGQTHYTNGYRLTVESTYRKERTETDDPISPDNSSYVSSLDLSAPLVMDVQASYRADDSIASLIASTHYTGSPLMSMLVEYHYDSSNKQLLSEDHKAWHNWWEGGSGDLYEDFQYRYHYTSSQVAYRAAIKNDPQAQTSVSEKEVFKIDAALRHVSTLMTGKNDEASNEINLIYSTQDPRQLEAVSRNEGISYKFSYNDSGQLAAVKQIAEDSAKPTIEYAVHYLQPGEVRIVKMSEQGEPELTVKEHEKGKCTASDLRLMIITLPHQRRCLPSALWL